MPRRRADGRGPDGAGGGLATGRLQASRGAQTGWAGTRPPRGSPDALQRAARRAGPTDRLDRPDGRLLAKPLRPSRRSPQKDGPMSKPPTKTRSVAAKGTSKRTSKTSAKSSTEAKGGDSPSRL